MISKDFLEALFGIVPKGVRVRVVGGYSADGRERTNIEVLVYDEPPAGTWVPVFVDEEPVEGARDVLTRAGRLAEERRRRAELRPDLALLRLNLLCKEVCEEAGDDLAGRLRDGIAKLVRALRYKAERRPR